MGPGRKAGNHLPTHAHSIHNRMLHLIQDVQKDASLQGAGGGGEGRGDVYNGLVGGGGEKRGCMIIAPLQIKKN